MNLTKRTGNPGKKETGMKLVVFDVLFKDTKEIKKTYGMADWLGDRWDNILMPDDVEISISYWFELPDPNKEPSKIIRYDA